MIPIISPGLGLALPGGKSPWIFLLGNWEREEGRNEKHLISCNCNGLQLHRSLVKYVKVDCKSSSLEAKFVHLN